ncbi:MAG TPA: IS5/IS1182 family transposase, partial [Candidatus Bacteroides intestinavium]|nr:IS5/IS1182 family transposase [Candidatus Bacteroides intestinavium]HJA82663.1 IS5/IS1182 family transposase [Candidatus Bacteroides intestinavium]
DSFRTLLNRFDTTVSSWMSWNYLAFAVLLLKKTSRKQKV